MKRAAIISFLSLVLVGCASTTPSGTGSPSPSPTPNAATDGLPVPVAEKRATILRAGEAMDYDTLAASLDPATFSYSFGDSGDPIGAWRQQEGEGQSIVGDILPALLRMPYGVHNGIYMWPRMASYGPEMWNDEDRAAIAVLYNAEDLALFEEAGSYIGYRIGIEADGTWIYFVAGD
jgi:hypothetical protein